MLDYLDGGNVGGIYGERLDGVERTLSNNWESVWRKDDWNAFRVRMEGEAPRITVWLNGAKITEFQDTANHAAGGATDGMIGVQGARRSELGEGRLSPLSQHRCQSTEVETQLPKGVLRYARR